MIKTNRSSCAKRTLALGLLLTTLLAIRQDVVQAANGLPTPCVAISSPSSVPRTQNPTLLTVEEGYRCILSHYVSRDTLDSRVLLAGAYNSLVGSLRAQGIATPDAAIPAFTGDRNTDWQLFAQAYGTLASSVSGANLLPGSLQNFALAGMTASLNDQHTAFLPAQELRPFAVQLFDSGPTPSLGIVTSPISATTSISDTAPLWVTDIFPGSPAALAGVRPGDVIEQVNRHPPYADVQGEFALAPLVVPQIGSPVDLTITRPATGETLAFHLNPQLMLTLDATARIIARNVYYVKLYTFTKHGTDTVFADLKALHPPAGSPGIVLDLRGNPGGLVDGAVRLLSAFVHDKTLFTSVDGGDHRDPQGTDDAVRLLRQHLAVLTDGGSASSSEIVASAVRDYHLGQIVGTRTAGALAGAEFFALSNGSGLEITEEHVLGPLGETVDGVGIAPDIQVTTTATDLSTGHDPVIDDAVRYLRAQAAGQGGGALHRLTGGATL